MQNQLIKTEEITAQLQPLMKWQNGSIASMAQICPRVTAWKVGVQTSTAYRNCPTEVALILFTGIQRLINYIQPKIGLDKHQIQMAVDWIIETYPTVKLEEILHVLEDMMKNGKYYERLQFPEIKARIDEWLNSEQRENEIVMHNLNMKPESQDKNYIEVDYKAYIEKVAAKRKEKTHDGSITQLQALERFERNICLVHEISYEELRSDTRKVEVMDVKKIIQYFQRYKLNWTYEKIGEYWGKDHSTMHHNVQSAIDLKLVDHQENE